MNEEVCRFCHVPITRDYVVKRWYTLTKDGRRFYYCADDTDPHRGHHIPIGIEFDT